MDPNSGNPDDYWDDQASKNLDALDTVANHPNNNPRLYAKHVIDLDADTIKVSLANNLQTLERMGDVAFTVTGEMTAFFNSAVLYRQFTGRRWFEHNPLRSSRLRKMQRKWYRHRGSPLVGYINFRDPGKSFTTKRGYHVMFNHGEPFNG